MLNPARKLYAITPGVTDLTPNNIYGIYVGGAGNVTVLAIGDTATQTFTGVPVGTILPVRVKQVTAATATGLIGLGG